MGLLSNLGLKPSQTSQADKAKADSLKAQFGKDFKNAVVLATRLRDQKAKAEMAKELKAADADLRKADKLRNAGERAQAMQAALDKVKDSTAKAKETQASTQDVGQAGKVKPTAEPNGKEAPGAPKVGEKVETKPKVGEKVPAPDSPQAAAPKPPPTEKPESPDKPAKAEDKPSAQGVGTRARDTQTTGGGPGVGQVGSGKAKPSMQDTVGQAQVPPKTPTTNKEQQPTPTDAEAGKASDVSVGQGGIRKTVAKAIKARIERAKAVQAEAAAAKSKAVARGNQLYKLFHADEKNTKAGQAHNRGMAKLASGDANAAKIKPDAEDFETPGKAAIDDYNAASEAFGEGLAMCGQAVAPSKPQADGGPAQPVAGKDPGAAKKDDGNSTTTTVKTSSEGGVLTRDAEVKKTTVGDGKVTKSRQRDTQQIGPGGVIETSSSETSSAGKDGMKVEKDNKVEVIDAAGKRSVEKKTTVKAGKDGVSSSDTMEIANADGSRDTASKDLEIGAKDGGNVVTKKSSRTHVDAAGNSATLKATQTTVTDKDGKVSTSNSMAIEKKSAQEAAAEKKKAEEEKKKAEEARQQREAAAKAMQAQAAAAKSKAVARGNQLYKLFHANETNTAAGQAHNRGMAKLASGDANAAKIKPDADYEAAGYAAITDYNDAAQTFGEGLTMCGQAVQPTQVVPESGGA